jgi:hypothetical protein
MNETTEQYMSMSQQATYIRELAASLQLVVIEAGGSIDVDEAVKVVSEENDSPHSDVAFSLHYGNIEGYFTVDSASKELVVNETSNFVNFFVS